MSAWNDNPDRTDPSGRTGSSDRVAGDGAARPDRPRGADRPGGPDRVDYPDRVDRRGRGRADHRERGRAFRALGFSRADRGPRADRGDRADRADGAVGERRYPSPASPRRERTDIYATIFALGLALFLLLGYALRPVIGADGVPGKVARVAGDASVDNGRAVARELISDGAASFLWASHWLAVAALLVVVLCGAGLARNFLLGDFFTLGSFRWVSAMCWALFFYMFVPGFVGMLGGNMVLRDLGLHWVSIPAIEWSDFIVMYVLVMTLSLIGVAIRRASVLERDTEGLV
ncbi:hypothetical protein [Corynebacterium xerosis]|uniref:hypothetical protein n=1 Tax=Corynebacterium xerosis TaxID=1725 RepID=UPI000ADAEF18|nr:hypothetical protein [Corynebacterium xerosis]SQB95934.1 Uncharacterised protein [Clostridium paraputrificum]